MKKAVIAVSLVSATIFATTLFKDKSNENLIREFPSAKNGVVLSYNSALKDAKKSVVNISTQKNIKTRQQTNPFANDPFFRDFFGFGFDQMIPKERVEKSLGSGVIINSDGYIVTNNHVIDGADKVIVTITEDKKEYTAKVVGTDPKSDLAIIKIEANNLTSIEFADSTKVLEGDVVFAIGNPFGIGETVTHGIVSALNKHGIGINEYENFIQTDAPINPGNSGGALIDSRGALIGINTAIISKSGASNGIGFAIPSNSVKKIALQLIDKGKVERGFIGVNIQDISSDLQKIYKRNDGAVVTNVSKDSPAKKGGVQEGDLIIEVNKQPIKDSADLKNKIGEIAPNKEAEIKVLRGRDNKELILKVTIGSNSDSKLLDDELIKGVVLSELNAENRKKYSVPDTITGILVDEIKDKNSETTLNQGDVIYRIEEFPINNTDDLKNALSSYKDTEKRVFVYRRGIKYILVIK